jgi:hypothetical protein
MRFAEIPRVRRCLGRLLAEAKLRKQREDAPKGGFLGDMSPKVHKALLENEIASRYPSGFLRVQMLEQAARYLTSACTFAEAGWPEGIEDLQKEVGDFSPGWNSYLSFFIVELRTIVQLSCWASTEEAAAVTKASPLYQDRERGKIKDELLWIGGDRLVIQLALLKRSSALLTRTDVFREPKTARDALRAIFEQEWVEAGLAPWTDTFQQRNPDSPLARVPNSSLAFLMFEPDGVCQLVEKHLASGHGAERL